jgi:hypothetical protein
MALESSITATRALAAQSALQSVDIGSMHEDRLLAIVAATPFWDQISGYGAVEASRATIGHQATSPAQVPSDVRWALAGPGWLAASRAAAARRAAPAFPEWDAARGSPPEPDLATNPDYIPTGIASGQRAESAHLATIPLPGEDTADGALAVC